MKTQKMKTKVTSVLLAALLFLASCGSKQDQKGIENGPATETGKQVEAPDTDLHTAAFLGDLKAIQQHIAAGSDLNVKEPSLGSTALISAAVFGKTEIARALMEGGADVNIRNNEGSTALHSAAFLCRLEIVEMLLAHGADKKVLNNYGSTPLQSVSSPFADVKFIYDQFSKDLGPYGFKLDYDYVVKTRPVIAEMLSE